MTCDVHHVPGRIRFKVPGLRNDSDQLQALSHALRAHEGVERVEIRAASSSLIVHYDPSRTRCHLLADTVNSRLSAQSGQTRIAAPSQRRSTGSPPRAQGNMQFVSGPVRQMGIVFGRAAFKVALEQAVRGSLNSLYRVTVGRG